MLNFHLRLVKIKMHFSHPNSWAPLNLGPFKKTCARETFPGEDLETWQVEAKGKDLVGLWAHLPAIAVTQQSDPVRKRLPLRHSHWMNLSHDDSHWTGFANPSYLHTLPSTVPTTLNLDLQVLQRMETVTLQVTWSLWEALTADEVRGCSVQRVTPPWGMRLRPGGPFKAQKSTTQPSLPHLEAFLLSRRICMQISQSVCRFSLQRVLEPWHERKSRETG